MNRPLPKQVLKKMFLKTLWEIKKPGTKYHSIGWSVDGILGSTLPFHFGLKNLDPDILHKEFALLKSEYEAALEGVEELQREGYLKQCPEQSNHAFKALTDRGNVQAQKEIQAMNLDTMDLNRLLSHPDALADAGEDYASLKFEKAVQSALKTLEIEVRNKAGLPASSSGLVLMSEALNTKGGVLKHPDAQTPGEDEAFHQLFRGAYGWLRNPVAHRLVGHSDPKTTAQILGLIDFLLTGLNECVKR